MIQRPKLKIEKEPFDWAVEIIGFTVLFAVFGYLLSQYGSLPERIPRHFAMGGNVDAYGNKFSLFVLSAVMIVMFASMYILNKFPHIFNYPEDMTLEEAPALYKNSSKLMRVLNTIMTSCFAYIIFCTIQTATHKMHGIGDYFMPIFIVIIFGPIIYYIIQASRIRKAYRQG